MSTRSTRYDREIESFISRYSRNQRAINVNFRKIIPKLNKADRASHLIHTYPAKLLMHIPHFFLNNNLMSAEGGLVLDPFCGSGTVLVESLLGGRNSFGADSNPLARLIAGVKVKSYDVEKLNQYYLSLKNDIKKFGKRSVYEVIDFDYWFLPDIQKQLQAILIEIEKINEKIYRDFFLVCFSNCVKKVSLADPRVSVPVKLKHEQYQNGHRLKTEAKNYISNLQTVNVKEKFLEITSININRIKSFNELYQYDSLSGQIISNDARSLTNPISKRGKKVDLIITSPPYAGAQKYIRASSLNIGWLSLSEGKKLKEIDNKSIGREEYLKKDYSHLTRTGIQSADTLIEKIYKLNPLRAFIAANYLNEMRQAFKESCTVLTPGGYFVLVAANNNVCGKEFKTQEYLLEILHQEGLKTVFRLVDNIKSYGLMTKRNKTANIITREWVLVLQK